MPERGRGRGRHLCRPTPGEFCFGGSQLFELETNSGNPQRLRAELIIADFDANGTLDLMTGHAVALGHSSADFEIIKIPLGVVNPHVGEFDNEPGADVAFTYNVESNPDEGTLAYGGIGFVLGGANFPVIDVEPQGTTLGDPLGGVPTEVVDLAVGSFDGDGRDDIAVLVSASDLDIQDTQLWFLSALGSLEFEQRMLDSTLESDVPRTVCAGRLHGDSIDDLSWGRGSLFVGDMDGPKPLTNIHTLLDFNVTGPSLIGSHLDCDSIPDLIVAAAGRVSVIQGSQSSPYLSSAIRDIDSTDPGSDGRWEPWDVADLNADGAPDVLIVGDGGAYVAFATTTGSFTPPMPLNTDRPWVAARAHDLDDDGSLELIGVFADTPDTNGGFEILTATP